METPFRNDVKVLSISLRNVNKALNAIDKLEKAAAKSAEADRPSTLDTMKKLDKQIKEGKGNLKPTKGRRRAAEI